MQNKYIGSPFPPELRTMSIVPRWSIVHVTQKDTVANHSYYVTLYSYMIARTVKWEGKIDHLMFTALLHDLDESVTGDIVGPIKEYIIDQDKMNDFLDRKITDRFGALAQETAWLESTMKLGELEEAEAIVKAADRLDAVFFLLMEERRGNTTISPLVRDATNRLEGAWRELPAEKSVIDFTWHTSVLPAIELHKSEGGRGV